MSFSQGQVKNTIKRKMADPQGGGGGVALGFTTNIQQVIKLISFQDNFLWAKLDKNFFKLDQDIFVCAINVPSRDSPYFNPEDLHNDIAKVSSEGYIMLTGDFNARTGNALYFVDIDECIHLPGDNLPQKYDLNRRKNYNPHINEHGQILLDICKTYDLRILNGRTTGDSFGKISYHSPKGISISHEILSLAENLSVGLIFLPLLLPLILLTHK